MNEPLHILCVFSTLDRGGAETMCMNLYRNIDRDKVQFDFVKHTSLRGAYEDEIETLGGRVYEAPKYKLYNKASYKVWWRRFLNEHDEYRIIHGHYFTASSTYLKVAKIMGRHTIGHIHASSFSDTFLGRIKTYETKRIAPVADTRFACSEVAGKWAYRNRKFTVLNNAVDSARFAFDPTRRAEMREQLHIGEDEKAIFVVANLNEVKNPLGTLDIYSAIKRKNPNACLFWVGEGGMRGSIVEKITSDHIPNVRLLGARSDVAELLQAADAFMLCSYNEGLPVVTIEAQASGLPCLLSSAITTEADITGLCCFLSIDQPKVWVEAAENAFLISRKDTRDEIIRAGYDIKETSAWLTNFYQNCVG